MGLKRVRRETSLFTVLLLVSSAFVSSGSLFNAASHRARLGWFHQLNQRQASSEYLERVLLSQRGGSTEASDKEPVTVDADDLYLPGLLEAALVNKNEVYQEISLANNL